MQCFSILMMVVMCFLIFVVVQPLLAISQIPVNQSGGVNNVTSLSNKTQAYEMAMKYYDKALSLDPNNTDILTNKGIILMKLEKYNEALVLFDDILHIKPDSVGALYNTALSLDKLGRYEEATRYYAAANTIDPNYKGDFVNRLSVSPSIAASKPQSSK